MKKLILFLFLLPIFAHGQKIRVEQMTSGSATENQIIKTDGVGNALWGNDSLTTKVPFIEYDTAYVVTGSEPVGTRYWDADEGTTSLVLQNGVILQDGQELYFDVKNQTGADLINGYVAAYAGAVGASGKMKAEYAIANYDSMWPQFTIGVITETIANGDDGKVTWFGKVRGIQTDGANFGEVWQDSTVLFLSPYHRGWLTSIMPEAPSPAIPIGVVIKAHPVTGTIDVRPSFPHRLVDAADVNGTPLVIKGQFPVWDQAHKYFDFNYNIWPDIVSNEVYSALWDGVDSTAASKNAIYDIVSTLEPSVTKGDLTETVPGLEFNNTRQVMGGAAELSMSPGYVIPTTTDTANWNAAYDSIPALRSDINQNATGITILQSTSHSAASLSSDDTGILDLNAGTQAFSFVSSNIAKLNALSTGYIPYKGATNWTNSPIYTNGTNGLGIGTSTIYTPGGTNATTVTLSALEFPQYISEVRNGTADNKLWRTIARGTGTYGSDVYQIQALSDDTNTETTALEITRSGMSINSTKIFSNTVIGNVSGGVATPTYIQMDGTYSSTNAFDALKFYLYKSAIESYGIGLGMNADMQYWAGSSGTGQHRWWILQSEKMKLNFDGLNLLSGNYYLASSQLLLDAHKSGSLGTTGQFYIGAGATSTPVWTSPGAINVSGFYNDAGYLISEVDGSTENELIDSVKITGGSFKIYEGGSTIPDSVNHTIFNISDGTGFLKNNGTGTWSYDNSTYLTDAPSNGSYYARKDGAWSTFTPGYWTQGTYGLAPTTLSNGVGIGSSALSGTGLYVYGFNEGIKVRNATGDDTHYTLKFSTYGGGGTDFMTFTTYGGLLWKYRAAPVTPSAGYGMLYPATDGKIYWKNADGTNYDLTANTTYTASNGVTSVGNDFQMDINGLTTTTSFLSSYIPAYNAGNKKIYVTSLAASNIWNAYSLQGVVINATAPTNGQALVYDSSSLTWKPQTISGGSSLWQELTGAIAPTTITDEVRIGSTTDLGAYILQVTGGIRADNQLMSGTLTITGSQNAPLSVTTNATLGVAVTGSASGLYGTDFFASSSGTYAMTEIATAPSGISGWGQIYTKTDNNLYFKEDNGTETLLSIKDVLKLNPLSSAPSSPSEGWIYVNSTDHHIYCYLNGTWKQLDN